MFRTRFAYDTVMRWLIIPRYACNAEMCQPAAQQILLIILRYACNAEMCRPADQRILLMILRYACDAEMCRPAAWRILLIIPRWENRQNLHVFNLWPVIYHTKKKTVQIQHRKRYLSKYTRHSKIIQNLHIFILWP